MARTNASRLNFLGVISVLIGMAAFVAMKVPAAGYGPVPVAFLGLGVGLLAFVLSLMLRWGSGTPVLGVLVSAVALALAGYSDGTLPAWWARIHPASPNAAPAVITPPPSAPNARAMPDPSHIHSIFDTDGGNGGTKGAPSAAVPTPPAIHTPAPSIATPIAPAPSALQRTQVPSIAEARAKLDAATSAVERALANDPAYIQAKADIAAADDKRKAALTESGPGSPAVLEASSQWLDAKSKLKKLLDAAVAKDPAAQAAQRELSEAQGNAHAPDRDRR